MCLCSLESEVSAFMANNKHDTLIPVYKYVEYQNGDLVSPIHGRYIYKPGYLDSGAKQRPSKYRTYKNIGKGFHVYTTEDRAKQVASRYKDRVVLKLYALVDDLHGINGYHAVFSRVLLTEKEYNKALKRVKSRLGIKDDVQRTTSR